MLSGHVLLLAGVYSQGLDGLQRGKESLADGLQLVVIEGEQVEILQVLKCVHAQTVDLVGIEEAASRREASDSVILPLPCEARLCPQVTGYRLRVCLTATAPAAESGWWGSGGGAPASLWPPELHTHLAPDSMGAASQAEVTWSLPCALRGEAENGMAMLSFLL